MKTLVIHPKDPTTDFLREIYSDLECTVISNNRIPKGQMRHAIKQHDKIIMLGHGNDLGLFSGDRQRIMINCTFVQMLREKECVCIWCNANVFVEKYGLKGFCTGMIISEMDEALYFSIPFNRGDINESNTLFSKAVKKALLAEEKVAEFLKIYDLTSCIANFNRNNIWNIHT